MPLFTRTPKPPLYENPILPPRCTSKPPKSKSSTPQSRSRKSSTRTSTSSSPSTPQPKTYTPYIPHTRNSEINLADFNEESTQAWIYAELLTYQIPSVDAKIEAARWRGDGDALLGMTPKEVWGVFRYREEFDREGGNSKEGGGKVRGNGERGGKRERERGDKGVGVLKRKEVDSWAWELAMVVCMSRYETVGGGLRRGKCAGGFWGGLGRVLGLGCGGVS